ncbi:hypothetical protein E4U11_001356 [Claviceps purpurea]|nr:hypothetical protein E4U11_001356 [Claviceps purpurea]
MDTTSPSWPVPLLVTTTALTVSLTVLARAVLWPPRRAVLKSPLGKMRSGDCSAEGLVYGPETFPGGRDVDTPDLFGRGFSDGVGDLPHDTRLYTSQILLALASSPLSWTGTQAFHLVGYSLGGGIAVPFANAFPHMVASLVLLAPAGLIDASSFGRLNRFVFASGFVPERILAILTGRRLQRPIAARAVQAAQAATVMAVAEADTKAPDEEAVPLEKGVLEYVRWMVRYHEGFVPAFMSCIRHAPLMGQHEQWRGLARRKAGTTAMIFAEADELIREPEYREQGLPLAGGEEHVVWRVVPGRHDFVMTHPGRILDEIDAFWASCA